MKDIYSTHHFHQKTTTQQEFLKNMDDNIVEWGGK